MSHGEMRWTGRPAKAGLGIAAHPAAVYAQAYAYTPECSPAAWTTAASAERHVGRTEVVACVGEDERAEFLALVFGADDQAPTRLVADLVRRGVPAAALYVELLGPTAEALGRMWVDDTCDFFDVTLGMGRVHRVARELGHSFGSEPPVSAPIGRALLACAPGEQHSLGVYMVAEFLLRDGWSVRVAALGAGDSLAAAVRDDWFDVVGFSAACDVRLLTLRREIASVRRRARNPHVGVLVGGRIFVEHPEFVSRVGADAFAASAADAPRCARALLDARVE